MYAKPTLNTAFMEIFEKTWNEFKFVDYETLNKVVKSPWSLVPVFEERYKHKLPAFLKPHDNELQELKNAIEQYLTIRHMINVLKWRADPDKMNEYPFVNEKRDVYDWNVGDTVHVEMDKTLVLCNMQLGNSLEMRYVVLDPEFFILIEPEFEGKPNKSIRIEVKAPLKNIDTMTDFRDHKRLIVGISELSEDGEERHHKFLLHFENQYSCRSVKKTIDDNKKNQQQFFDALINSYFEQCIEEVQDDDAI